MVDRSLRAPATTNVFAAGDMASAATDDAGHRTLMSCQHALLLGRCAGHNAAALVLGVDPIPYSQVRYGTGLDLGPWGAVQTTGWERRILSFGAEGKVRKRFVNGELIYPPKPDRATAFAAADPAPSIAFYARPA
jgi:NADH dehydrogenase